jgi:hypothetical protein
MRQANLFLHCGSQNVSREQITTVATPQATATWCPIPHHALLTGVADTLSRAGMTIVSEAHGLSHDRNRYFGLLQIANSDAGSNADDFGLVVGLRNTACGLQFSKI